MLVAIVALVAMAVMALTPSRSEAAGLGAPETMPNAVGLSPSALHSLMFQDQLFYSTKGPGSTNGSWVRVVGEIPAAGTTVARLSTVTFLVTTSPGQPTGAPETMPNAIGLSPSALHSLMFQDQLYYSTKGPGSTNGSWVRVVGEIPAAGTTVARLSTVTFLVTTSPGQPSALLSSVAVPTRTPPTHRTKAKVVRPTVKKPVVHHKVTRPTHHVVRHHSPSSHPVHHVATREKVGIATWYSYVPGRCATWYLPFGVRVTVTDLANGRSVSCVVTDREGATGDHAVDLSQTQFAELAPLAKGVIPVRVTW